MTAVDVLPGLPMVARFPHDQTPTPAVVIVHAVRGEQALVAKWRGRFGGTRRWARPRWIPIADIARPASAREAATGAVIDPLPARAA